ncbi:MAG: response regulator [Alphaproteobacteria bacterium]|jgi:two-component system response regulator RegA|nr:response regulator [Alphaproteobacteria bacterium]MDP6567770.1 response regulator [Alphaproteobacteria bacterium]
MDGTRRYARPFTSQSEARPGLDDGERTLLIVDDDAFFREALASTMIGKGFKVRTAEGMSDASASITADPPGYAIVELRLSDDCGLDLIPLLRDANADARVLILTGHESIATAVAAMKAGAIGYFSKPGDPEDLHQALTVVDREQKPVPPKDLMTPDRVRWEHIHRIFELCKRDVEKAARLLDIHPLTLRRTLGRHPPP